MKLRLPLVLLACFFVPGLLLAQAAPPGSAEDAGLERLIPDTIMFFDNVQGNSGNWEPYIGSIGVEAVAVQTMTFVVSDDPFDTRQQYGMALQPIRENSYSPLVGDIPNIETYGLWGDPIGGDFSTSEEFKGMITDRQNGNPGRISGDRRPGGLAWLFGGETAPHIPDEFQSDGRWELGLERCIADADSVCMRYGGVQFHTLQRTGDNNVPYSTIPTSVATDAILGRLDAGNLNAGGQIGRMGGGLSFLSDGNAIVTVDDRSNLFAASTAATAVILAPDGSVVTDSFVLQTSDVWDNTTSVNGAAVIRLPGTNHFVVSNDGSSVASFAESAATEFMAITGGAVFQDTGRGDGNQIQGNFHLPNYVQCGQVVVDQDGTAKTAVYLAVWDASADLSDPATAADNAFVTAKNVSGLTADNGGEDAENNPAVFDRCDADIDANGNIATAYEATYEGLQRQTLGRLLKLDTSDAGGGGAGTGSLTYSSGEFFWFLNHDEEAAVGVEPMINQRPKITMTTEVIGVAAKGQLNEDNDVEAGATGFLSGDARNFYTVIKNPAAAADPTDTPFGGYRFPGDNNGDGKLDISDPVALLNFLFASGAIPSCYFVAGTDPVELTEAGAAVMNYNGDAGGVNIADPIAQLNFQFAGGNPAALGEACVFLPGDCTSSGTCF